MVHSEAHVTLYGTNPLRQKLDSKTLTSQNGDPAIFSQTDTDSVSVNAPLISHPLSVWLRFCHLHVRQVAVWRHWGE